MAINVPNQTRDIIPAGNYVARCYSMVHLGTIPNNFGTETKTQNRVLISWELPTLTYEYEEEEVSSVISKEYTLTMGQKGNLRSDLESWRGKSFTEEEADNFDLTKLLGAPCMLNIIHKTSGSGSTYARISSISRLPKGLDCPPPMREMFEFNYTDKFSEEAVANLPDFMRSKVKMSQEYLEKIGLSSVNPENTDIPPVLNNNVDGPDDDLPF